VSRWLVVMGSGETTPTMVSTHQRILAAVGPAPDAVLLDTPYGFQENADELTARTRTYFARNVGTPVTAVSLRSAEQLSAVREEEVVARVGEADWVFAGPGSPTYLAQQWRATRLPAVLRDRLAHAGATVFASAAACTLGALTVPVYEIYKAGEAPHWCAGLDLLAGLGLDAVTIPHFDNSEGGTHDTRFCYLGERRLVQMEALLPPGTWVLGVDEHTALLLDLAAGRVRVEGRGGVTVRARDVSVRFPAGSDVALEALLDVAYGRAGGTVAAAGGDRAHHTGEVAPAAGTPGERTAADGSTDDGDAAAGGAPLPGSLGEAALAAAAGFDAALAAGDALAAAEATVGLLDAIRAWSADSLQSDEVDRAGAEVRRQVVALARVAAQGLHAHRDLVAPHVEQLLELRDVARQQRRFGDADAIREALASGGVEVRDRPDGTGWEYRDPLDAALARHPDGGGAQD
jgi:cyanophycinase-like exopeptidase